MKKIVGRVINVISHCAYLPLPGVSLYGASKAAMRAFTIGSRVELKVHGVRMISFSPGTQQLYFYLNIYILFNFNSRIILSSFCHYV